MTTAEHTPEWLPNKEESYLIFGFTGQGQQRPDMFEPWYGFSPETDKILQHFHNVTQTAFEEPLDAGELENGPLMQPANVTLAVLGSTALAMSGIKPNETFGHSLGEYGATHSAGFIDAEDVITLSRHRGVCTEKNIRQLLNDKAPGGMLGVMAKTGNVAEDIKAILRELAIPENEFWISNFNTRKQIILSGLVKHFEPVKEQLQRPIRSFELNVDGPYHSLLMRFAKMAMKEHVDEIGIKKPKSPKLYSPTTVGRLNSRDDVANMLLNQLIKPVRYDELITARLRYLNRTHISQLLGAKGASEIVFVEIGPYAKDKPSDAGVLIGLTKDNVAANHNGDMPIRFHRVTVPEDIMSVRLTNQR